MTWWYPPTILTSPQLCSPVPLCVVVVDDEGLGIVGIVKSRRRGGFARDGPG